MSSCIQGSNALQNGSTGIGIIKDFPSKIGIPKNQGLRVSAVQLSATGLQPNFPWNARAGTIIYIFTPPWYGSLDWKIVTKFVF